MNQAAKKQSSVFDKSAALARGELAIKTLKERHVMSGWPEAFDYTAADQTLAYLRDEFLDEDDDVMTPEFMQMVQFFNQHGIAIEWILLDEIEAMIARAARGSKQAEAIAAREVPDDRS